jgi:lauroyl/myristoyl acyltransferase
MTLNLQPILNSPHSVQLISTLGRVMPVKLGYRLADMVTSRLAVRQDLNIVRAVRLNQWVVRGQSLSPQELDQAARETLRQTARSIFDLHHFLHNPQASRELISFDSGAENILQRQEFSSRGLMIVGIHLTGFDLVLQCLSSQGFRPLTLTIPNPQGASRTEYEMRKKTGMNLVPTSPAAFRQALRYLQRGGTVLTGMDRPVPDPEVRPRFFGYPSVLPIHHIYLAVRAQVPVRIIASFRQPDGSYQLHTSTTIEMETVSNRELELLHNAEKILAIAEDFIRPAPQHWTMSLPVWPQLGDRVPT